MKMKKMMTAFAVCMIAGLVSAQVESQNIVGYTTKDTPNNKNMIVGVSFVDVGQADFDIQSLKMSDDVAADGGVRIWWWVDGVGYSEAYWVELYDAEGEPLGYNGWGDAMNWEAVPAKTFAAGDGFWIKSNTGGKMVTSGELVTTSGAAEYLGIDTPNNENMHVTSPLPIGDFDIQSVKMSDGVAADGGVRIWWWVDGVGYSEAYWVELYDAEGEPLGYNGWGDAMNWEAVPAKTFEGGDGFWIKSNTGGQVQFPNPFYGI
jgi:hypothetical protein